MSDTAVGGSGRGETSGGISDTVADQATRTMEQGKSQLSEQLDERTTQVGRQLSSLGQALRRSSSNLQAEGTNGAGVQRVVTTVADRVEQAGSYLERASGHELVDGAERFARRQPWLVAGVAAAVGMAASRLLKASSERRYETSTSSTAWKPAAVRDGGDRVETATLQPSSSAH
jgi:ElaB/YqjD/DUF883 family membrane-anchored ribosome-binding protein